MGKDLGGLGVMAPCSSKEVKVPAKPGNREFSKILFHLTVSLLEQSVLTEVELMGCLQELGSVS